MTIDITKPELEDLIRKRLETGAFQTIEEVIEDALASQNAEAEWLMANKENINDRISGALDQLDRGEGISGDVARARMQQRKKAWLADRTGIVSG